MWSGIWRSDGAKPEKIPADASRAWTAGTRRLFCGRKSGVGFLSAGKGIRPKMREVAWTAPFPDQAAVKGSLEKMRKKRRVTVMARTTRRFRRTEPPFW